MTDETKPARVRGLKDIEAAYRQGFIDGATHAHEELSAQRQLERKREDAMTSGLNGLRRTLEGTPKRARRSRRADNVRVGDGQVQRAES